MEVDVVYDGRGEAARVGADAREEGLEPAGLGLHKSLKDEKSYNYTYVGENVVDEKKSIVPILNKKVVSIFNVLFSDTAFEGCYKI